MGETAAEMGNSEGSSQSYTEDIIKNRQEIMFLYYCWHTYFSQHFTINNVMVIYIECDF
jgi:hypothetical protein